MEQFSLVQRRAIYTSHKASVRQQGRSHLLNDPVGLSFEFDFDISSAVI